MVILDYKSCLGVLWTAILLSVPHCSNCISLIPEKQERTVTFTTVYQIFFSDAIGLNTSCDEAKTGECAEIPPSDIFHCSKLAIYLTSTELLLHCRLEN